MEFNENLKAARKKNGLTQQQIADSLDIDKSTYSGYETGKREPDVKKIKALSKLLGVSPDILLGIKNSQAETAIAVSKEHQELVTAYDHSNTEHKNMARLALRLPLVKEVELGEDTDLKTS